MDVSCFIKIGCITRELNHSITFIKENITQFNLYFGLRTSHHLAYNQTQNSTAGYQFFFSQQVLNKLNKFMSLIM
jgi:hypothetical protein